MCLSSSVPSPTQPDRRAIVDDTMDDDCSSKSPMMETDVDWCRPAHRHYHPLPKKDVTIAVATKRGRWDISEWTTTTVPTSRMIKILRNGTAALDLAVHAYDETDTTAPEKEFRKERERAIKVLPHTQHLAWRSVMNDKNKSFRWWLYRGTSSLLEDLLTDCCARAMTLLPPKTLPTV